MTRTGAYKAAYFSLLAAGMLVLFDAVFELRRGHVALLVGALLLFAVLLVPGRALAYFWSDLLASLHHLNQRNYQSSKEHSERFLAQLRERPWLKRLIWLGTSAYSRDAEVLALNNLGAAMVQLGEFDSARETLSRAIALDPKCPLPYKNMGTLVLQTGAYAEALPWFEKAAARGLKGDWTDRWVNASQRRNAALYTTGSVSGATPPDEPAVQALTGAFLVEVLNDDQTPVTFVIAGLEQVFGLTGAQAIQTVRAVDREGRAVCAAFETMAAARAKADQLSALAREAGFPLRCVVAAAGRSPR